ncbi:MAG TPA: twin-arginine translocation signal domain-containing protein [Candidatus Acidoferrum sp.]|nr:twin-arginine translocation signal domain-containing protein [Candidatus Acidoferrum sp.]
MAADAKGRDAVAQGVEVQTERRNFMRNAAAAGLLGAAGAVSALAQPTQAAAQQAETEEQVLKPPAGMSPRGIPDLRFPMCYKDAVPAAVGVMTKYFAALGQRDLQGMAEMLHFPFGTFERTEAIVVHSLDELMARAPASMNLTEHPERFTDHDGYLKPGCYDVLDGIEIFNSNPVAVNLSLNYNRYSAEGYKLLRCEGIYCVTNNDGKWAIQAMSTIFTPAYMLHVPYNDSVAAARRLRQDHCLAYMNNDQQAVWGLIRQLGPNLGVDVGGASWEIAAQGHYAALERLRAKGVNSRLTTTTYTQEMLDNAHVDFAAYRALWPKLGLGNWGWDLADGPPGGRIIHASFEKVHAFQGASRYTTCGEYINDSVEMDVITYRKGRWGIAGLFGYMTTHDRANDVRV